MPAGPFARALRRIVAIARKEVMHIRRDVATLYFALAMPVLLLALFGYAVSFDLDHVRTVVVDEDQTAASRELAQRLFAGGTFVDAGIAARAGDVDLAFRRGEARMALVIPRGYGRKLAAGDAPGAEAATAQLLVDAADNQSAGSILSYVGRFGTRMNARLALARVGPLPPGARVQIAAEVRALYNPALASALFLVPGLVAMIQSMMAVLLTALTVAREWERGSMEQLFATPVGRLEIVIGKLVPYFGVAMAQLLLVLTAAAWLFDLPFRGSIAALVAVSSLFLLTMLAQGLLISVVTKNQMVATQIGAMTSMLPAMLLSGFMLPIENMPAPVQLLTRLVPARYFVHASRGILLRGAGEGAIAADAIALAIFATVLISACVLRFRRRVA